MVEIGIFFLWLYALHEVIENISLDREDQIGGQAFFLTTCRKYSMKIKIVSEHES